MWKTYITLGLLFLFTGLSAQQTAINDPIKNFEALWSRFDQHYANFDLKKVDWGAIYDQYRPQINDQTTNQELFEVLCTMVQELNDGHVSITPNFEETDLGCGAPYAFSLYEAFPTVADRHAFRTVMDLTLQNAGFSEVHKIDVSEDTNFQYRTSKRFGYLRMDEMTEEFIFMGLGKALKEAFSSFENKEGLIIDMRFNGGGYDESGLHITRYLTESKRLSHTKYRRIKGTDKLTKGKQVYVKPKGKQAFTKPVVVLISNGTASAAEVFLLSVKDLPQVTILGERSEGIFSDMYEFSLPNKWEVSLSNMVFIAKDGKNYEGIGVQPDYKILNSNSDLKNNIDPVLIKALEVLNNH